MNYSLDCYPCLVKLIYKIADLSGLNTDQIEQTISYLTQLLVDNDFTPSPPVITGKLYNFIHRSYFPLLNVFDPYVTIKEQTTQSALDNYETLRSLLVSSMSPHHTALKIAAAGNVIDFAPGNRINFDIADEIKRISELTFDKFHIQQLEELLGNAHRILYILDNAGETVFDKILLEFWNSTYPQIRNTVAVRSKPILNDATLDDALHAGLDSLVPIITSGSYFPGIIIEEATPEFRYYFDNADIIISKGQGNFETLSGCYANNLFFLLKAKCSCVARETMAPINSLLLLQNTPV